MSVNYIIWAFSSIPGVTRAWAACEIGPGTMTVRFMMDDLRADNRGVFKSDPQTCRLVYGPIYPIR